MWNVYKLHRRVKPGKTAVNTSKKFLGHYRPIFTGNQEHELANYILLMENELFGLTRRY